MASPNVTALQRASVLMRQLPKHFNPLDNRHKSSALYECYVMHALNVYLLADVPVRCFQLCDALPRRDIGIDGLNEDFTVAVQAKFYKPGSVVSWSDIGKFHTTCAMIPTIERRIVATPADVTLVTTADGLSVEHVIMPDESFVEFCSAAASFTHVVSRNTNLISLYPWQKEAIDVLGEKLSLMLLHDDCNRVAKMIAPCASGKTRVVSELINRGNYYPCVLFTQPHLVDQVICEVRKWVRPTVRITPDWTPSTDILVVSNKRWESVVRCGVSFKLRVVDEAHIMENAFDEPCSKRPKFETKQPKFHSGVASVKAERTLLLSANLKDLFCDFRYSFVDAVESGAIADFNIVICTSPAAFLAKDSLNHILAYCDNKDDAKDLCARLNHHGIFADEASKHSLPAFTEGKLRVLCMSHQQAEGVDIPMASACLMVGTKHKDRLEQCIGRVLRNHESKSAATILFTHMTPTYQHILQRMDPRLGDILDFKHTTHPRIYHSSV